MRESQVVNRASRRHDASFAGSARTAPRRHVSASAPSDEPDGKPEDAVVMPWRSAAKASRSPVAAALANSVPGFHAHDETLTRAAGQSLARGGERGMLVAPRAPADSGQPRIVS